MFRTGEIPLSETGATAAPTAPATAGWLQLIADPCRLQILEGLSDVSDASVAELLACGSMSGQTVRRHLEDLVAVGIVEERPGESDGATPGRPPARFRLRPELRASVRSVFEVAL